MINVELKEYCEGCPNFEAKILQLFFDHKANYLIRCEHADKCRQMYMHVKHEMESKKEKNDETL